MSTPDWLMDLDTAPPLDTPEGLFDFFEHLRIRRPFLRFTKDSVIRMYRGTAKELGIDILDDSPYDLWPSRDLGTGGVESTSTADSGDEDILESSNLASETS